MEGRARAIDIPAGWALQLTDEVVTYMWKKFRELCELSQAGERALPGLSIPTTDVIEANRIAQKLSEAYRNPSESPANDRCRTLTELRRAVRIPFDAKRYLHALNPRETGQGEERERHLQQMFPPPYNPLTTITRPAVIVDVTSIVLVWYLPDGISSGLQVSEGVRDEMLVLIPMR